MIKWNNLVDEKKVFIDLFNIYEQELLTIFQFVAPININNNLETTGNKIHELHLRVCAECENLVKQICKKLFPERDYDNEYRNKKYKNLKKYLDNMPEEYHKEIEKNFYSYADMPFYLDVLNTELWICDKKIEFCKLIETKPENQILFIQPFNKNSSSWLVPLWREHYNKLKHDKINYYNLCTLFDLINSLGAYYMLLHYFVLNLDIPVWNEEIPSLIFKLTVWWIKYPVEIIWQNSLYIEHDPKFFKGSYIWDKRIVPWYYDDEKMKNLKKELNVIHKNFALWSIWTANDCGDFKNENYFFYNSLTQQGVITQWYLYNWVLKQKWWILKMEKRFNIIRNNKNI